MYNHKNGITLRKLSQKDLSKLLSLKEESWWGTHQTSILNMEDQLEWYNSIPNNELYMIAEKEGAVVGVGCYTNIDWICRSLNASGSILKNYRDPDASYRCFACGLDFAFEILNMQRVGAEVLETHGAAQHLEIGYLGFKVEGRRRRAVYKSGRYYDSIQLGLLREEWESQNRVKNYEGSCNQNFDHTIAQNCIEKCKKMIKI